jgi:hypothetical protein
MSIVDAVLFVSTTSRTCVPCLDMVQRFNMPINIVRLDTQEARRAAMGGQHFQVQNVPTLVLIYDNSDMQMFVSAPKIIEIFNNLVRDPSKQKESEHTRPPLQNNRAISQPIVVENDSDEEEITIFEESEPKPPPTEKKTRAKKRSAKRVTFQDQSPEQKFGNGKKNGKGGQMSSLIQKAKQMEIDRKDSLGYREEDLPRSSF